MENRLTAEARRSGTGSRLRQAIRQLSPAMNTLSQLEQSAWRSAGRASSDAGDRVTRAGVNRSNDFAERAHRAVKVAQRLIGQRTGLSQEADSGLSSRLRQVLSGKVLVANSRLASSIRGLTVPPSLSQREFADASGDARGRNSNMPARITVNSSPTVVINAPAGTANIERDALGALRAHREELFDQLQRESARRERAQF